MQASPLPPAGVPVENATLASPPETMTMDDWESQNQPEESGGMPGWAIGLIVAFVLLLVPWPGECSSSPSCCCCLCSAPCICLLRLPLLLHGRGCCHHSPCLYIRFCAAPQSFSHP